jgi:hypothetical protein
MIIGLLAIVVGALLLSGQQPSALPPTVILVERAPEPADNGRGCLPALVLLGLLAIVLLSISVS